ncbi:hypothetical protein FJT64_014873 [Amphibalanus amphitrite]|uniref:Transposase n=1 Tax=Amphibalanus amphitrite TaxID=1232801 RepID=A0A6A4V8L6_AMPAM|nr:hypothetical protein FJT64_014873 [Amphibalanus amphitrite]
MLVNGTLALIEQKLDRPVLQLACRHHVKKLVLEKAFSTCRRISSGLYIRLFKRFKGGERLRLTAAEAQVIRRCALFVACKFAAAAAAWSGTLLPLRRLWT